MPLDVPRERFAPKQAASWHSQPSSPPAARSRVPRQATDRQCRSSSGRSSTWSARRCWRCCSPSRSSTTSGPGSGPAAD